MDAEGMPFTWKKRKGIIIPMWQKEALWIKFGCIKPCALKVGCGKINVVTGKKWKNKYLSYVDPDSVNIDPNVKVLKEMFPGFENDVLEMILEQSGSIQGACEILITMDGDKTKKKANKNNENNDNDDDSKINEQNYLAIPKQPWLDGINAGDGYVRQFVAMPLGKGYTIEAQVNKIIKKQQKAKKNNETKENTDTMEVF